MKRVIRNTDQKLLCGLCGAIGKAFDIDPTIVRLIVIFLTFASGLLPGIGTYLLGWLITPTNNSPSPIKRWFGTGRPTDYVDDERFN